MTLPDVDTLNALGGVKANAAPVEDATTDLDASYWNKTATDVAAATHTAIRSWVRFTSAATTGAMVLQAHDSVWGNSAPVAPVLARTGTGAFTITLPASVTDEAGGSHTVALRAGFGNFEGGTAFDVSVAVSANVITVNIFNVAGALTDAAGTVFNIFTI